MTVGEVEAILDHSNTEQINKSCDVVQLLFPSLFNSWLVIHPLPQFSRPCAENRISVTSVLPNKPTVRCSFNSSIPTLDHTLGNVYVWRKLNILMFWIFDLNTIHNHTFLYIWTNSSTMLTIIVLFDHASAHAHTLTSAHTHTEKHNNFALLTFTGAKMRKNTIHFAWNYYVNHSAPHPIVHTAT